MAATKQRTIFLCSCERTMPLHGEAVARGCGSARVEMGDQFCGADLDRVKAALAAGGPITIGCTYQAPLFRETAEAVGLDGDVAFANVRETAGWSSDAANAGPKTAALLAAAAEAMPPTPMTTLTSEGVVLVYGRDEVAIEAGQRLAETLDVTVMLSRPAAVQPPAALAFPIVKGTIRSLTGYLGTFEAKIDDFAVPAASSRGALAFGLARNGATSRADIVLDLSGGPPLVGGSVGRDGYLRADPENAAAVAKAIARAADLVGEFDKPRYIRFTPDLCAHSRSRKTGCTRCLSACPTGAITPNGDHVAISAEICMGCGACSAVCPTGAVAYDLPRMSDLMRRLRTLLQAYRLAGGVDPIVLFHGDHGAELVDAVARQGVGLPANILPVALNEPTELGIEAFASAFAWGAAAVRLLAPSRRKHDLSAWMNGLDVAQTVLSALGYGADAVRLIETDDPDHLLAALRTGTPAHGTAHPSSFLPVGAERGRMVAAVLALHDAAPQPSERITLPAGAPFGGLVIDTDGCTLCLSCVAACPTGALSDDPERPTLRFTESACVQCGLCAATCPEKVIRLAPRLDFAALAAPPVTVKQEEPFPCIACGKPFGTRSTVERIVAKLEQKHWMFTGRNAHRLDLVRMCDDCRVNAVMNEGLDPFAGPARPRPRTAADYLDRDEG